MNFYPMYYSPFFSLLGLLVLIVEIVVIVDIFKSSMDMTSKLLWTLLVLLFPILGILLYFAFGRMPVKPLR
jgi:hypothetical protein